MLPRALNAQKEKLRAVIDEARAIKNVNRVNSTLNLFKIKSITAAAKELIAEYFRLILRLPPILLRYSSLK